MIWNRRTKLSLTNGDAVIRRCVYEATDRQRCLSSAILRVCVCVRVCDGRWTTQQKLACCRRYIRPSTSSLQWTVSNGSGSLRPEFRLFNPEWMISWLATRQCQQTIIVPGIFHSIISSSRRWIGAYWYNSVPSTSNSVCCLIVSVHSVYSNFYIHHKSTLLILELTQQTRQRRI